MRIALHQPLHCHPILQRLWRIVPLLHRTRGVGKDVAEALAPRQHEQQLIDRLGITPVQLDAAGVFPGDDAALIKLQRPRDRGAGRRGVEPEVVADVVQPDHALDLRDADVGTELSKRHVFGSVAAAVLVGGILVHLVERTAVHRAAEAAAHPRTIGRDVLGVQLVGPGRLLVVLRPHRAEQPGGLVEKRCPHRLQGVFDDGGAEELLGDLAVVTLVGLRRLEVARLPLHDNGLHLQRSHLGAGAAARVAGLGSAHDRAAQHLVLARDGDVHHGEIAIPLAADVLRDPLAQVDVVEPAIRLAVHELDLARLDPQHRPGRRSSEEDDVVDAVHADEGGEVVAGVGVHEDARLRGPRRGVAARRGGHDAGEHAGSEDQRDVGVQGVQRLVQQPIKVEHVGAAPGEQRLRDPEGRIRAHDLALLEVDEDSGALRGELRFLR